MTKNSSIVLPKALAKKTVRLISEINALTEMAMRKPVHNGVASLMALLVLEKAVWSAARLHGCTDPKLHKLVIKLHDEAEPVILKCKTSQEARLAIDLLVEKAVYAAIR